MGYKKRLVAGWELKVRGAVFMVCFDEVWDLPYSYGYR